MSFKGSMDDRLLIRELLETYADAVCELNAEAWSATWASESEWHLPGGFGTYSGKEQILIAWRAAMTQFPGVVFAVTLGAIDVSDDRAVVRSYTSEVYTDPAGQTHRDRGRYKDVVIKEGHRWLFKSRRFDYIHRAIDGESIGTNT
jgi:hypothetical protein